MINLNFSGHPATIEAVTYAPLYGNLTISDSEQLREEIIEVLLSLEDFEALKGGETATIILPSMSTACGIFLASWHGLFGSFPIINWAVRTEKGFEFLPELNADLQGLRNEVREKRF